MTTAREGRTRRPAAPGGGRREALVLAVLLMAALSVGPAAAQETGSRMLTAEQAMRLAAAGEIVVVDIRSPQEWRQTGVPKGARTVTLHQPDGLTGFLKAMDRSLGDDRSRPIALICARGNRSTVASAALARAGYTRVYNIREGMFGSPHGPGWLARGLPTAPCNC